MEREKPKVGEIGRVMFVAIVGMAVCCVAQADINLEFRPFDQVVNVGETVNIGLYAVSDTAGMNQNFSAIQTIISWDAAIVRLVGLDQTGAVNLLSSSFPDDPHGLNEANPPQDGDGIHVAFAPLGSPIDATPDGILITTIQFEALHPAVGSRIDILEVAGDPQGRTTVFGGNQPNHDVTGTLAGATFTVVPGPGGLAAMAMAGIFFKSSRKRAGFSRIRHRTQGQSLN